MLSKSCEYALRAVFYITVNAKDGKNVGIKEISEELDMPAPFLAKIMQSLAKNKIVNSIKGPNGGFFIKNPKKISLIDIVESIDGTEFFHRCTMGLKKCSNVKPCPIHNQMKGYRDELKTVLSQKTLDQVMAELESNKSFI
ncbi:MAG: RrF2 family transcriptional regulator [Cytophagaceae bacterium]